MIAGAVVLALMCWAVTFGQAWGNFWIKIGVSVTVLCAYSLLWQRPRVIFSLPAVLWGTVSAAALYGIFVLGHILAPYLIPGAATQVGSIYALGDGTSRISIFLLLCFVTGPGEEIFWRGFLQERLMARYGDAVGFAATTAIYAGVHVFSLNLMLILAALVAGAFWGALYLWRRNLALVIVSHSLWSATIFTLLPVGR